MNSTRQELSNDMSHDTLSQLYQKLVTYWFFFPKARMINTILKIQNSAGKVIFILYKPLGFPF